MNSSATTGIDDAYNPEASETPEHLSMPCRKSTLFGAVGFLLVHGALPSGLSLLTRRYGWGERRPGRWNMLGLILVLAGSAYAIWGLVLHSIEGWQWERTQAYFLQRGPYRFSRNPMYVGELALWLGWAIFYGSISVLIGFVTWWVGFSHIIVPQEEHAIEERYGDAYRRYKSTVPRWLGRTRGRSGMPSR